MREILFRSKRKENGKWVYGGIMTNDDYVAICRYSDFYGWYEHIEVIPETVGQFTGLYDATPWEDLTETEKKKFYNSVKSEDGKTIKYESVEDVKRLWKGKPIFEGDIVECFSSDYAGRPKIDTIKVKDMTDYNTMVYLNCSNELRNIGNIHDNPELLEVTK